MENETKVTATAKIKSKDEPLQWSAVYCTPPAYWGTLHVFYYYDDDLNNCPHAWPGTVYPTTENGFIFENYKDCRVILTDGQFQYPEKGEPGFLLHPDEVIEVEEGRYSCHPYSALWKDIRFNYGAVNKEIEAVLYNYDDYSGGSGTAPSWHFLDETDNEVIPYREQAMSDGSIYFNITKYTFIFDTPGLKKLKICEEKYGQFEPWGEMQLMVFEENSQFKFTSSAFTVYSDDEVTLTVHSDTSAEDYAVYLDDRIPIMPIHKNKISENTWELTFKESQLGVDYIRSLYLWEKKSGQRIASTGCFITLNAWKQIPSSADDILVDFIRPDNWTQDVTILIYDRNKNLIDSRIMPFDDNATNYFHTIERIPECFVQFMDSNMKIFPNNREFIYLEKRQSLIVDAIENEFMAEDRKWLKVEKHGNLVSDGQSTVTVIFEPGLDSELVFSAENFDTRREIKPSSVKNTVKYRRIHREFTFTDAPIDKRDEYNIRLLHIENNHKFYSTESFQFYDNLPYRFHVSQEHVFVGDLITFTAVYDNQKNPFFIQDDSGENIVLEKEYDTIIEGKAAHAMVYKVGQQGGCQNFYLQIGDESGSDGAYDFATINVWENCNTGSPLPVYVRLHMSGYKTGDAFIHYYKYNDPLQENAPWPGEPMIQESYSPSDFTFTIESAGSSNVSVTANIKGEGSLSCTEHIRVLEGDELFFKTKQSKLYYLKKKYELFDITQTGNDLSFPDMGTYIGEDIDSSNGKEPSITFKCSHPLEINRISPHGIYFHRYYCEYRFMSKFVLDDNTQIEVEIFKKENGVETPTGHVLKLYYNSKMKVVSIGTDVDSELFTVSFYPYRENENYCIQEIYKPLNVHTDGANRYMDFSSEPFLGTQQQINLYKIEDEEGDFEPTGFHSLTHFWKPC